MLLIIHSPPGCRFRHSAIGYPNRFFHNNTHLPSHHHTIPPVSHLLHNKSINQVLTVISSLTVIALLIELYKPVILECNDPFK